MNYYYLDGLNKLGPYSQREIWELNLPFNTLILREDKSSWLPKSEFKELELSQLNQVPRSIEEKTSNFKINKLKYVLISVSFVSVMLISFWVYKRNTLDEETAKELSLKFFNMLIVKNNSTEDFEKIYPSFGIIGTRTVFNTICEITNISKNAEGEIEIFATYKPNKVSNIPIYLLIAKENGAAFIKSSKGINYAYYNNVLNYGKKMGCLSGTEDDVKMGLIITDKNLKFDLDIKTKLKVQDLYSKIKKTSDLQKEYGYTHGEVTISNASNIFLSAYDFTCRIEYYDSKGNITSSEKLNFWEGIPPNGSATSSIYSSTSNASTYKIIFNLNDNDAILNKVKDEVIANTNFGCN
jgi:hypothetical protein